MGPQPPTQPLQPDQSIFISKVLWALFPTRPGIASSTIIINGFKNSGYINIAHSDSWKQSFGNVIYDCPQQTIFVVDLNGYLRNITGDFKIKSTNNKTLRLSTTQSPTINIGGSLNS